MEIDAEKGDVASGPGWGEFSTNLNQKNIRMQFIR